MRIKYLFLAFMLLVLAGSITAIAANESVVDNYKFTVPDNFTIANSTEHVVTLLNGKDHKLVLSNLDDAKSPDQFKANLKSNGYKISDNESNFTAGIFDVRQNEISKDKFKGYVYICDDNTDDDGDDELFITFTCTSDNEDFAADNTTVVNLLKSIKEVED